jgi:hypothetical protein
MRPPPRGPSEPEAQLSSAAAERRELANLRIFQGRSEPVDLRLVALGLLEQLLALGFPVFTLGG